MAFLLRCSVWVRIRRDCFKGSPAAHCQHKSCDEEFVDNTLKRRISKSSQISAHVHVVSVVAGKVIRYVSFPIETPW